MTFLGYPKDIPYTTFEHFGIIRFFSYATNKQTNRRTRYTYPRRPIESVWIKWSIVSPTFFKRWLMIQDIMMACLGGRSAGDAMVQQQMDNIVVALLGGNVQWSVAIRSDSVQ